MRGDWPDYSGCTQHKMFCYVHSGNAQRDPRDRDIGSCAARRSADRARVQAISLLQHLPAEEVWLIGEHRTSGEKKYCLANLPAQTDLRTLAATIKARWICEQAHQQRKE
jgi:hypothetical protein